MPTTTVYADRDATVTNMTGAEETQNFDAGYETALGDDNNFHRVGVQDMGTKGTPNLKYWDTLLHFDLSGIATNAEVSAASLNTYRKQPYHSGSANGTAVNVYKMLSTWAEATVTWATTPGISTLDGSYTYDHNEGAGAAVLKTVTGMAARVEEWVQTPANNFGWRLMTAASVYTYDRPLDRADGTTYDAFVSVTYNRPPGAPAAITSPTGGSSWDATLTITNTAATDPESDAITYEWEYSSNGGGAWSALSGYASSLSRVIDVSAFAAATTYRVRVRAKDAGGSNTPGPWTTLGSNFTIQHNDAPTTPGFTSLMGASNGGAADLEAGGALVAPFNDPDVGDTPSAILIRRKIGMGSWSYWRDSDDTWQATEQENASGGVAGHTFPAGVFTNGNTYVLQVAYEDALGERSPWSADFTVTGVEPATVTVTDPVSPVTDTSQPIVEWSVSSPGGWDQERAVVIIEHGAYGTTPGSGTEDYDSGDIVSVTARDHQVGVPLSDGVTYRAFVHVETNDVWAAWAYRTFTMDLTVPDTPSIVVTEQPDQGRTMIEVAGAHSTVAFPDATAVVESSDDGGDTWAEVGTATYDSGPDAVVYDYQAPLNRERLYRARTEAEV